MWDQSPIDTFWLDDIFTYAMVAAFVSTIYMCAFYMQWITAVSADKRRLEIRLMQEREVSLQSQLNSLKLQINPHFLFNCFNNLISLIENNPKQAETFTANLSKVYRHVITNLDNDLITIDDELTFLNAYIELMKVRHGNNIVVNVSDTLAANGGLVPPAVLQLLVENAIKHNGFSAEKPLIIDISADDSYITVSNNLLPLSQNVQSTKIGQKIIIDRYQMLCGKQVTINETENSYIVKLPNIKYYQK